jgi:hypothetical protein
VRGPPLPTDFRTLLEALVVGHVRFVVIGGLALVLRGGSRITVDVDVCYARDRQNLERLASALAPLRPRLRGAPPELPFLWDAQTLCSGLNFTLRTEAGDIDLFGEVPGVGDFAVASRDAETMSVYGLDVPVMSLDVLERAKRAAGRAKDLLDLAEIAELRKLMRGS